MDAVSEFERIRRQGQIGIIAGSGPEAGADLWMKLLDLRRQQMGSGYRGDLDAPQVRIISLPILGLSMDMDRHAETIWPMLRAAAIEMAEHCVAYTIACNTLHFFADELRRLTGDKFISVQDAVRSELASRSLSGFALLGAAPVMSLGKWSPYSALCESFKIETAEPERINRIIYSVKHVGRSTPELEADFLDVISALRSEVIVLGCTELPLIQVPISHQKLVDVTQLLAKHLLEKAGTVRHNSDDPCPAAWGKKMAAS
jgi:aspartate racemase